MAKKQPRMPSVQCPACGESSFARNIGKRTLVYRELYYHCREDRCGHIFAVAMEALRTIRPSMVQKPLNPLPLSDWPRANDRGANDDSPPDEPAATAMTG